MEAVALPVCRSVKLEKSEFNRSLCKSCMVVKHMVAAVVVMAVPAAISTVGGVPNVSKLRHRLGLPLIDFLQEAGVDRAAVAIHPSPVNGERIRNQPFMACHDVSEVSECLRCVAVGSDVDVDVMNSFP